MDYGLGRPNWVSYINPDALEPTDFEYAFKQLETQLAFLLRTIGNQGTVIVWRVEGMKPNRRVLFTDGKRRAKIAYFYNDPITGWEIRRINPGWPV